MARYINLDDVVLKGIGVFDENLDLLIPLSDVRKALQMTPTADVVPKSEVEKLYKEIDRLSQVVLYHDSFKADEIKDAEAEVAREIFEEIEAHFDKRIAFYQDMRFRACSVGKDEEVKYANTMITNLTIYKEEIAELKKKYTDG